MVASKPGFYSITGTSDGPIIFIGNNRDVTGNRSSSEYPSRFGIGVRSDSSGEEDSYESTDDRDVSDVSTWIPYQEVCLSTSRLTRAKTSQPSKARYSDRLISTYMSLEGLDFVHPSPNQVLDLMLDSIRKYHSLRYGSYIQQLQVLGRTEQTFLDLLQPAARDVYYYLAITRERSS